MSLTDFSFWDTSTPLNLLDSMYRCHTLTGYIDLRNHIQRLESENTELKARLEDIHTKSLSIDLAVRQMEDVLKKFQLGRPNV